MMYLLDTHAVIWYLMDDDKMPEKLKETINRSEDVYVSMATFWEMQIKEDIGKLPLQNAVDKVWKLCAEKNIRILPIGIDHIKYLHELPMIHNDPFDRVILSQAKVEDMVLISKDEKIQKYDVNVLWD